MGNGITRSIRDNFDHLKEFGGLKLERRRKLGKRKNRKKGKDFFAADKRGLTQIWRGRKERV